MPDSDLHLHGSFAEELAQDDCVWSVFVLRELVCLASLPGIRPFDVPHRIITHFVPDASSMFVMSVIVLISELVNI